MKNASYCSVDEIENIIYGKPISATPIAIKRNAALVLIPIIR
jgi:hypothetical protein